MLSTIRQTIPPLHREGYRFVAIFATVTLVLWWISDSLGTLGLIATLWCAYFFRDPARVTPTRPGLIIAPADGRVLPIVRAVPPAELEMGDQALRRISIFMNVFDVHVNRIPTDGEIITTHYHPGKFLNAELDKASVHNERQAVRMRTRDGKEIAFVQIAGLVARRILCQLEHDQSVKAGERFGLIRFGSRVDVYLDESMTPFVIEGQRTVAGETVIAETHSTEAPRQGIKR